MIRKLRPPKLPVIPSLGFTMQSVEHTSRYGPARPRTKKRHTLRSRAGKGEPRSFSRSRHLKSTVCRRFLGFIGCLVGAAVCFAVAFLTLPLLAIRPAKFALSFRYVCTMALCSSRLTFLPALVACWLCSGKGHTRKAQARLRLCISPYSFSVLIGPINHIRHLISKERLPFSIAYLVSLGLTLYFALGVRH